MKKNPLYGRLVIKDSKIRDKQGLFTSDKDFTDYLAEERKRLEAQLKNLDETRELLRIFGPAFDSVKAEILHYHTYQSLVSWGEAYPTSSLYVLQVGDDVWLAVDFQSIGDLDCVLLLESLEDLGPEYPETGVPAHIDQRDEELGAAQIAKNAGLKVSSEFEAKIVSEGGLRVGATYILKVK